MAEWRGKMTKYIELTDEGYVWAVKAEVVADNRAKYYVENDKETTYAEEFEFAMSDDDELIDWMTNNMNFEDFGGKLFVVLKPDEPDEPDIANGDYEIKEIDGELVPA
jgi:hypothetical protein